ncbi:ferritin subunit [Culex quinquefasciatus]|uniref:Ferritin subunit n=1 Tax=Culex quinquefasciatus TaxID=7176 RepID=B0XLA2_CULQU|nr:ferritin subunit [Culex quinquefasciatus]|eukprot:XP_001870424.1 ferritin subunit [Culex quinquefasciatus]
MAREQSKQDVKPVKPYFVLFVAVRDKTSVGTETAIYPSPWPVQPPGLHFLTCRCCYQEPAMAHQTGVELEREYVWNDLHRSCVDALHASIVYLKYAAYFAQEKINLPGFEKFFFHAAGEEREHGTKLIEYALMRRKEPVNKNTFQLDYSYKVPAATTGLPARETRTTTTWSTT